MLDFPRPLPISISFTGELGRKKENRDGENTIITVLTLHICRTKLPMSRCSLQKRDYSLLFHALSPLLSVHNPCFIIKQKHVDICRKCDILPFSSHNLSRTSQLDNWKHEKGIDRVLAWNCFQYDKHAQNYDCKLNIKSCVRSIIVQNIVHHISHGQDSFVGAFARIDPGYTILWRMEMEIEEAKGIPHLHLLKWLPQRDLMSNMLYFRERERLVQTTKIIKDTQRWNC